MEIAIPDIETIVIWSSGLAAFLVLVLLLQWLSSTAGRARARRGRVAAALDAADMQRRAGQYAAAWQVLDDMARLAPGRRDVRLAREALAMDWLRHIRVGTAQQTFGETVRLLQEALVPGANALGARRRGDALAHQGWAEFLLWRDGDREHTPEDRYRQALAANPGNPYAHAMQAHWLLLHNGPIDDARRHFAEALAAGRAREDVRLLQIAAYGGSTDPAAVDELFRTATDMRRGGEPLDDDMRKRIADGYLHYSGRTPAAVRARRPIVPVDTANDDRQTMAWLLEGLPLTEVDVRQRDFCLASLDEAAGRLDQATAACRALRDTLSSSSDLLPAVDAALGRLTVPEPRAQTTS